MIEKSRTVLISLDFSYDDFNFVCNLIYMRREKIESIRAVGSAPIIILSCCNVKRRRGRRRSARRRGRSHMFPKFRMIVERNAEEGGREYMTQEPLSSHCHRQVQRLHTCDTLLRDCYMILILASGPSTSSRSFYSTAPRLSLYYIIRNYIIYTPQISIFISLILSKLVARSRRMEREQIIRTQHTTRI